jgi:hypothetical protein
MSYAIRQPGRCTFDASGLKALLADLPTAADLGYLWATSAWKASTGSNAPRWWLGEDQARSAPRWLRSTPRIGRAIAHLRSGDAQRGRRLVRTGADPEVRKYESVLEP